MREKKCICASLLLQLINHTCTFLQSPETVIKLASSPNPDVTVQAQVLLDKGFDPCSNNSAFATSASAPQVRRTKGPQQGAVFRGLPYFRTWSPKVAFSPEFLEGLASTSKWSRNEAKFLASSRPRPRKKLLLSLDLGLVLVLRPRPRSRSS